MEAFAPLVLAAKVLADGFEPQAGVGLEQLRAVAHNLQNEDLDVDMGVGIAYLIEQVASKLRHLLRLALPLLSKEALHSFDATLDVLHAPVLVDVVQLEPGLFLRNESSNSVLQLVAFWISFKHVSLLACPGFLRWLRGSLGLG